jgi:hypothetical protein
MRFAMARAIEGGYTLSSSLVMTSVGTRIFSIGAARSCATEASSVFRYDGWRSALKLARSYS